MHMLCQNKKTLKKRMVREYLCPDEGEAPSKCKIFRHISRRLDVPSKPSSACGHGFRAERVPGGHPHCLGTFETVGMLVLTAFTNVATEIGLRRSMLVLTGRQNQPSVPYAGRPLGTGGLVLYLRCCGPVARAWHESRSALLVQK